MLERIYVHNFRCFENFDFSLNGSASALLIGRNGSGKSTLRDAIKVFQSIGRGANRVGELVKRSDFTLGRSEVPMRFEISVRLRERFFVYKLALELPERFKELRVLEEELTMDGDALFRRRHGVVTLSRGTTAQFNVDWHLVALPVIQDPAATTAMGQFREWLRRIVLLAPIPSMISGEAFGGTPDVVESASNGAEWLSDLLDQFPSAYSTLQRQLKQVMPDLADLRFERTGREAKTLLVRFKKDAAQYELPFESLSDGEKCFFLCATLLATNEHVAPVFTFWDEPDNFLSLGEVGQFVMALRKGFVTSGGQIIMTSHNPEAIRRFSDDTTWVMGRRGHLEPTVLRPLEEMAPNQDLIQELIDGGLDPWQ